MCVVSKEDLDIQSISLQVIFTKVFPYYYEFRSYCKTQRDVCIEEKGVLKGR